jgi:conjugal transfer pilus assembly protein TraK
MVEDNARVECVASQKDLTHQPRRRCLRQRLQGAAGNPLEDFSVVNEPTRGDIYLSVPGGFKAKALSFFGTSKKGFVYKFACRIDAVEAQQIFLSNPGAAAAAKSADADEGDQQAPDLDETAVRLVQAMAGQKVVPGFRMEKAALVPVRAGTSPSSCSPSTAGST